MNSFTSPKVSIGLPIYNGERFIRKRLKNILSQTFADFELIIYDNSTDFTPQICKEYASDNRIQYIHENKRVGWIDGSIYVLKKAKGRYFVWAAVDDLWSPDFLEENVKILDSNENIVASHGKVKRYGSSIQEFNIEHDDSFLLKMYKRFRRVFRTTYVSGLPAFGPYVKKAELILRKTIYHQYYGIIRIEALRKSLIEKNLYLWDWAVVLNLLKHGDFHIVNKTMYHVYIGESTSRGGIFSLFRSQNPRPHEYVFPCFTFTFWCLRNIGMKFFLRNIDYFLWLNFIGVVAIIQDLVVIFLKLGRK